jgi:cephalosporin-C deacetylase-like acetyl esterase
MKLFYPVVLTGLFLMQFCWNATAFCQNKTEDGEVVVREFPVGKNAIFEKDSAIAYSFNLKNTYKTRQQGKLSYQVNTLRGKFVAAGTTAVDLEPLSSNIVHLAMPGQKTGFYKVSFMLNLNDYDDTVRRVFGVDIKNIVSEAPRPPDFDQFWANAKRDLAKIHPDFKVTARPDLSSANDDIFLVEMKSLDNITVRGWMTLPKDRLPNEKLPAYIMLPGYGAELVPFKNVPHFACLALNVRGLGNSNDVIGPTRDEYITYNIQDKNKYIYRGALMDCVRLLDFVDSRPEFDTTEVFVTGGSMGAYLSLALASIDKRVTLCAANNPTFSDWRTLVGDGEFPMYDIEKYARNKGMHMENVLKTLDYFDLKNFTPNVKCKTIFAMGLLDKFAPPNTEMAAYNKIDSNKLIFIYPNLGHEVDPGLATLTGKWVYENFRVYEKILAQTPINSETAVQEVVHKLKPDEVDIQEEPLAKDAIFRANRKVSYTIDVQNTYEKEQTGTIAYEVSTTAGDKVLAKEAFDIKLGPKSSKKVTLDMPPQCAGFYKVSFMINVTDYDDTIRRVFGVNPEEIKSGTPKPPDFDEFWENAKKELATVDPQYRMTEQPDLEHDGTDVFLVEMQSLDNLTIRGYLTIRHDRRPNEKFPVWILVPGYGLTGVKPIYGSSEVAVLSLNVRGEGNSRDRLAPTRIGYLTTNIEDKKKYIYRGAIMDCIRGIDFVCQRPELDPKSIICAGGSMGAYLSMVAASLDKRVKLCSANNPVFSDYRSLGYADWPMRDVKQYAEDNSLDLDALLNNLDYYDLKNFTPRLRAKTLLGISLLDNSAPPYNEYVMINNIPNKNKMFIYPNLGHEVPPSLFSYLSVWMMDNFGLY